MKHVGVLTIYKILYIYIYIYIERERERAFVGLDNKRYKIHGTYIKNTVLLQGENHSSENKNIYSCNNDNVCWQGCYKSTSRYSTLSLIFFGHVSSSE